MTVLRFDPFRDFDRLADQARSRSRVPAMPLDAYRRTNELVLQFDLPGVDPASVDVTVERNVLTVTAERPTDRREGDELVVAERPTGRFTRQLQLGDGLDTDRVTAGYDAGVLTVTFPVADEIRPRRIEVQATTTTPPISAESHPSDEAGAVHAA
jgi:HSP20 family protein